MASIQTHNKLPGVQLPERYNYVGVFLTFACNYRCDYCINWQMDARRMSEHMSAQQWADALNRLRLHDGLPISLQGGEPTVHREFYDIIDRLDPSLPVDLLTNLQFDVDEFMRRVPPERIKRDAPYASIRASYHPQVMSLPETIEKTLTLLRNGYSIGLFGVLHPEQKGAILRAQQQCRQAGIDFRTKEFLGTYRGRLYGTYRYPQGLDGDHPQTVWCRASELLVDPAGYVYRCHHDLYRGRNAVAHILDEDLKPADCYRICHQFGRCNPCDLKLKNNRFQQFGHCSVEVADPFRHNEDTYEQRMPDQSTVPVAAE